MVVAASDFRVGDRVLVEDTVDAIVVFSTVIGEFSDRYPPSEWASSERGVMVEDSGGARIFFPKHYLDLYPNGSLKKRD